MAQPVGVSKSHHERVLYLIATWKGGMAPCKGWAWCTSHVSHGPNPCI